MEQIMKNEMNQLEELMYYTLLAKGTKAAYDGNSISQEIGKTVMEFEAALGRSAVKAIAESAMEEIKIAQLRGLGNNDLESNMRVLRGKTDEFAKAIENVIEDINVALTMGDKQQKVIENKVMNEQSQNSILEMFKIDIGKESLINPSVEPDKGHQIQR